MFHPRAARRHFRGYTRFSFKWQSECDFALMAVVSLAAGLLAARRATKVDPMVALRRD